MSDNEDKPRPLTQVSSSSGGAVNIENTLAVKVQAHAPIEVGSFHGFGHIPLPEEHPFYALVGRVASEWSHLEHILDLTIWDLAGFKREIGACITSQIMGVGGRCKAIGALGFMLNIPDIPILKSFRILMNDSYSVADDRARIVHDPWFLDPGSNHPGQFRSMPYKDPHFGVMDVDKKTIGTLIDKIRVLQKRAIGLREQILAAAHTSP